MRNLKLGLILILTLLITVMVAGCGTQETQPEGSENENDGATENAQDKGTITFGMSYWTSTKAPTEIVKLLLEEAGYTVEYVQAEQPVLFAGIKKHEIDFFMDAWLPYTEAELWEQYKDDLTKVATSYEEAPLGWVVPSYVEENSIEDLKGNAEKYEGRIVGLSEGSGMTETSRQMVKDYGLEGFKYQATSEAAMMTEAKRSISKEEPIIFLGWRPHSMFVQYDLKFLEDPQGNFKSDNVYVISYKGIEEEHPEAYEILSNWSIEISDLEEMMYANEKDGVSFETLAQEWIENNPDKVKEILGE